MKNTDDKIQYIKKIAKELILHYLRNHLNDEEKVRAETKRINDIFENTAITFKTNYPGNSHLGINNKDTGIIIYVSDENNITLEELNAKIETIVHEFYHSISNEHTRGYKNTFLEEGYVTEITAETIRYGIENSIFIDNFESIDLAQILSEQKLINGYCNESSIVRSSQVIMKNFGYNGMLEYIYSENGAERIYEIASEISPDFADIISKQRLKSTLSNNVSYEKNFFYKMFDKIDFSKITETDIEMNEFLHTYLVDTGKAYDDPKLYYLCSKYDNKNYFSCKDFYTKTKTLSNDELKNKICYELSKFDFEYKSTGNCMQDIERMVKILQSNCYSQSEIKPQYVNSLNSYSILIAYDMYERCLKNPSDEDILEYCKYICFTENDKEICKNLIKSNLDIVYTKCKKGKKISEILNEHMSNQTFMDIMSYREMEDLTEDNFWDKLENFADSVANISKKDDCCWDYFYMILVRMTKKYISFNKIYRENDWSKFREKMTDIYIRANLPMEFMNKIGLSPDKIFLKAISSKTNYENNNEQIMELLKIATNKMDLGIATDDLDDFVFDINTMYENLNTNQNVDSLQFSHFFETLINAYYTTLEFPLYKEVNSRDYSYMIENPYIENIFESVLTNPAFYANSKRMKDIFTKQSSLLYNTNIQKKALEGLPDYLNEKPVNKETSSRIKEYILETVFGEEHPDISEYTEERLEALGNFSKLYIILDKYISTTYAGNKEKAEELWEKFYPNRKLEITSSNDGAMAENTQNLYNKIHELLEASPEVNLQSISEITSIFENEFLREKNKENNDLKIDDK